MVKILAIGDPHFKVSNVQDTNLMSNAILSIANDIQPDLIVVLGDILDRHETIHVTPLCHAVQFLYSLSKITKTYVLIGNHDLKNNKEFLSSEHCLYPLKFCDNKNMVVVDTTTMLQLQNMMFIFVPYVPVGKFQEALNKIPDWKSATCIFAHQEFKGAKMGSIISQEGDDWPVEYPLVISGHIHEFQQVQKNIIYIGTPIQHSYGDSCTKTISLFKFNLTLESHERIKLHGIPCKKIIKIHCDEVSSFTPDPDSNLKIIIHGTSGEIKNIVKHPNVLQWKKHGHKVIYKEVSTSNISTCLNKPRKYSEVFYNSISNNKDLIDLFNKLFGKTSDKK